MYDGAQEILQTIAENERSSVHSLDLTVRFSRRLTCACSINIIIKS